MIHDRKCFIGIAGLGNPGIPIRFEASFVISRRRSPTRRPQKLMQTRHECPEYWHVSMRMDVHSKGIQGITEFYLLWSHKTDDLGLSIQWYTVHALWTFDSICDCRNLHLSRKQKHSREKILWHPLTWDAGRRALPFWPVEEVGYHSAGIACIVSAAPVGIFWMQTMYRNDMFQVNLVVTPSKQPASIVSKEWAACFSSCRWTCPEAVCYPFFMYICQYSVYSIQHTAHTDTH